jgi:hypothetical protein
LWSLRPPRHRTRRRHTELMRNEMANKITGANAGGPRLFPMRTRWAARVAQFGRSAHPHALP